MPKIVMTQIMLQNRFSLKNLHIYCSLKVALNFKIYEFNFSITLPGLAQIFVEIKKSIFQVNKIYIIKH